MTTYGTDYQYLNIRILNDPDVNDNKSIPATYDETRVQDILDRPDEYELSIVRFSIPTNTIPIFLWPGDETYKISIEWRGFTASSYMTFAGQGLDLYGKAIYHYQELCDSFNVAMDNVFNIMSAQFSGALPLPDWALYAKSPPRLIFDAEIYKFRVIVPYETADYNNPSVGANEVGHWGTDNPDVPNKITVYFNREVEKFLSGFQFIVDDINNGNSDTFYELVIKNNYNNIIPYPTDVSYVLNQTYSNISNISDFSNVIFRTTMPIVAEFKAAQNNEVQYILTDFIPSPAEYDDSELVYVPQVLRYYPITTNENWRHIDVQVYWQDSTGKQYPVYILPNKSITLKIQLRKRPSTKMALTLEEGDELN